MRFLILTLCLLASCKPVNMDISPSKKRISELDAAKTRLTTEFMPNAQVVSFSKDGKIYHKGDSLLWTGLALGVVSCKKRMLILAKFAQMQQEHFGYLVRYHPLPDSYKKDKNQVSFDGLTGVLFGLVRTYNQCDTLKKSVTAIYNALYTNLKAGGWVIYPGHSKKNVESKINVMMRYIFKRVAFEFGLDEKPSFASRMVYENALASWVGGVKTAIVAGEKRGCYPVHLATIHAILVDELGESMFTKARKSFCTHSKSLGLYLTDWYCGRSSYKDFLLNFDYNVYEYAHQRCYYEKPDAKGLYTPGLDFIILESLVTE